MYFTRTSEPVYATAHACFVTSWSTTKDEYRILISYGTLMAEDITWTWMRRPREFVESKTSALCYVVSWWVDRPPEMNKGAPYLCHMVDGRNENIGIGINKAREKASPAFFRKSPQFMHIYRSIDAMEIELTVQCDDFTWNAMSNQEMPRFKMHCNA